jgi:hypothetical protein
MKRYLGILGTIMIGFSSFAQLNLDQLMTPRTLSCDDIARNSTELIMTYYYHHRYDSVDMVLDDWEAKCGTNEPIQRTRILNAVTQKRFSETIYDSTMIDYIINFINRSELIGLNDENLVNPNDLGYVPLNGDFDVFTQKTAFDLLSLQKEYSIEELFCKFYAGIIDDLLKEIQNNSVFTKTNLYRYYYQAVASYLEMPDFHAAVSTGIWIPQGQACWIGNHPMVGFQIGKNYKKIILHYTMNFKFSESKNPYLISRNGIIDTCTRFFGGYMGIDMDRKLLEFNKNRLDLSVGIGYDGFDAVYVDLTDQKTNNDEQFTLASLNLNVGFGYTYYFSNKEYITLQGKYNFVNYNNPGGTDLSGNVINVSVFVGGLFNPIKYHALRILRLVEK